MSNASPDLTKRSIYLSVFQTLLANLQALPATELGALGSILMSELENRQLFVSGVGESAGWNGELVPNICLGVTTCVADTLYLVNSNSGINKANARISQNVTVDVGLRDTVAEVSLNARFTNKSIGNVWPLGNYKNYLRFYLPASASVSQVVVDTKALTSAEYTLKPTPQFLIVGVLVNIDSGKTVSVGLNYTRNLPSLGKFAYSLNIPNQPGVDVGSLSVAVRYPPTWLAQAVNESQVAAAGLFRYNSPINKPFRLNIDFLRHD